MSLLRFFRRSPHDAAVASLYRSLVDQARQPVFYATGAVPDTLDGRFDMVCLHSFLVLRRLKQGGEATAELWQSLFDLMCADLDRNLRELGVSDYAIGHRMKFMVEAVYGRLAAYEAGLADGEAALKQALARNLFGTAPPAPAILDEIARYVLVATAELDRQETGALAAGRVQFPVWHSEMTVPAHG